MYAPHRDPSQSLDLLGLDSPFAEAGEVLEAEAFEVMGETPFAADSASDEVESSEGFEPAAEAEEKAQPDHKFKNCTTNQKTLLIDVADRALAAVRHAAAFVGSDYGRPDRMKPATKQLLLRHFHTTRHDDLRHILSRYMRIAKAIQEGISFEGERQCQATSTGQVCGYAIMTQLFGGFGRVHICFDPRPGRCDFTNFSQDEQEAIVIHEVAHRYVGIDDKAYQHEARYAKLTPQQALDNADSYAFFAVEGLTTLKEAFEPETIASLEGAEVRDAEGENSYRSEDSRAESWTQELETQELEVGFERCTSDESFAEAEQLSESPAWTGSAEQVAFRRRVLAEHIKRSTNSKGKSLPDLRDDELEKIPGTKVKTRIETARAAGRLLAAARADLAKGKAAGDADALRTTDVDIGSGYRGSSEQREAWLSYFAGYYNRTRATREGLPGGPHSEAAVAYMLRPEGYGGFGLAARIAAPGFSNHQNGIAIDFTQTRTSQKVGISTNKENRRRWSKTWLYGWLKQNAATYGFAPYQKEEWHWEYRPKGSIASDARFERETAGRAVGAPAETFLGGSIWTYSSRACATQVAIFVPPAASRREKVDVMLYVHGLLGPCGAPKILPEGIVSAAPFRLGQLIVNSSRPMVLVVPRFQPGNDKSWSSHDLDRPGQLNALFAEVLGDMARRLGRPTAQIDQLVIAGHSRAFGVLYPLARSHASRALATGALARLSKVWVLDATYGTPPMAAFESLVATRPGLGVDIVYRAASPTDKFGGRSRAGPVALRPINSRSISHCAVPGEVLPTLIAELAARSSAETGIFSGAELPASSYGKRASSDRQASISYPDYEDEAETLESLPSETLAWLDMEAGPQPEAFEPELTEAKSELAFDLRHRAGEDETETITMEVGNEDEVPLPFHELATPDGPETAEDEVKIDVAGEDEAAEAEDKWLVPSTAP